MTFPLRRVSALLFGSGACALVYQIAWLRELRLIFGASTAASAAVLAVFMGGLGVGGLLLGKKADASRNPLALYAKLELLVAATASITPFLVLLAQAIYLGLGGAATLGNGGATVARLLLTVVVLGPSTIVMGGTLPAAAKAVERLDGAGRQRVATLYGVNTMGAVAGTIAANFLLVEVFGTRMTLWLACLLNALIAMLARAASRRAERSEVDPSETAVAEPQSACDEPRRPAIPRWFPPFAAGIAGLCFLLMELVWYRMLAPLLGGSSYTFGLILAIALAGIGIGGALYARTRRPATLSLFALTCTLEALAIGIPYALGDKIAIFSLLLRPLAQASFGGAVTAWTLVAAVVVLPGAIVSGFQFPAVIGLYGRGSKDVGRDVGSAYLANTVGSIVGSVAGGFGLLPLLSAPRCWQLVVVLLVATALLTCAVQLRETGRAAIRAVLPSVAIGALAALAIGARGPTHLWRHSGIGAGRADSYVEHVSRRMLAEIEHHWKSDVLWEEDGLESSVALGHRTGFVFIVNGKADGHTLGDAGTQVMSGMIPALLHPEPKSALVVGLGTGSTAGWLGAIPSVERVDVMELEPSILRVARDCSPVNHDVMDNPKVHVHLGDAREGLRTTRGRYDIVVSEPSNPYRAGISSLYTAEYYEAVKERLTENGLFVQWVQAYEVDAFAIATTTMTVRSVFPSVMFWQTEAGDLVLVAERNPAPIDVERIRQRLLHEPYSTSAALVWKTTSAEGVLARFVARPELIDRIAETGLGVVNRDDQNVLEFAFARHVGSHVQHSDDVRALGARLGVDLPHTKGAFDRALVYEERMLQQLNDRSTIDPYVARPSPDLLAFGKLLNRFSDGMFTGALKAWEALDREPRSHHEALLVAEAYARTGDDRFPAALEKLTYIAAERDLLRGVWLLRRDQVAEGVAALERGFVATRRDAWVRASAMYRAIQVAREAGSKDPATAARLAAALSQPFAVEAYRQLRIESYVALAHSSKNPKLCVEALDAVSPFSINPTMYRTRVLCYRDANDPRLSAAEAELGWLLSFSRPFGADLKSPPTPATPPPPPPEARIEDGGDDASDAAEPTPRDAAAD